MPIVENSLFNKISFNFIYIFLKQNERISETQTEQKKPNNKFQRRHQWNITKNPHNQYNGLSSSSCILPLLAFSPLMSSLKASSVLLCPVLAVLSLAFSFDSFWQFPFLCWNSPYVHAHTPLFPLFEYINQNYFQFPIWVISESSSVNGFVSS